MSKNKENVEVISFEINELNNVILDTELEINKELIKCINNRDVDGAKEAIVKGANPDVAINTSTGCITAKDWIEKESDYMRPQVAPALPKYTKKVYGSFSEQVLKNVGSYMSNSLNTITQTAYWMSNHYYSSETTKQGYQK